VRLRKGRGEGSLQRGGGEGVVAVGTVSQPKEIINTLSGRNVDSVIHLPAKNTRLGFAGRIYGLLCPRHSNQKVSVGANVGRSNKEDLY